MVISKAWEYLDNGWTLAAFVIFLLIFVLPRLIRSDHYEVKLLINKIIIFSLAICVLGFIVEVFRNTNESVQTINNNNSSVNQEITTNSGTAIAVGGDFSIDHLTIIHGSSDYQFLKQMVVKAKRNVEKIPDDSDFIEELQKAEENLKNFTRNILKLAAEINKISFNSVRGKKAKQLFEKGDYQAAREVLNVEEMSLEQQVLINKQQQLLQQRTDIAALLNDLAGEFILKAKLTAVDFQLGDQRIAKTRQYFEQALIADRAPEYLFEYAFFLNENRLYASAQQIYLEVLEIYRELAKESPSKYQPYVTGILNNLAVLQAPSCNCRNETEEIHQENLRNYRELAIDNPDIYLDSVAMTLHNLGLLVGANGGRDNEAETYYQQALGIYSELAKDNPAKYLPSMALTLNNLGALIVASNSRHNEAEEFYQEALKIYRKLVKDNPAEHLLSMGATLHNLGNLVASDNNRRNEMEEFYQEALEIYRKLAKDNPTKHLAVLGNILASLGKIYLDRQQSEQAVPYLQEAYELFTLLPKQSSEMFVSEANALIYYDHLRTIEISLKKARETRKIE